MKRILDVGQCNPDHAVISRMIADHFEAQIDRAHGWEDALAALERKPYDLVLINRLLDRDGSQGILILERIKADPGLADTPVMLISNYPEAQAAAIAKGAVPGFGKDALGTRETIEALRAALVAGSAIKP